MWTEASPVGEDTRKYIKMLFILYEYIVMNILYKSIVPIVMGEKT